MHKASFIDSIYKCTNYAFTTTVASNTSNFTKYGYLLNPLCTSGLYLLVGYNILGMYHCKYRGATGRNFQIELYLFL